MKKISKIGYRIIVLAINFCLIFEQVGFAQIAPQLGVPAYLNGQISADKFRPMQLRSLSYDSLKDNFSLYLDKGDIKELAQAQIEQNSLKLMEYFRVGIVLPNSKFWVNLRPDKADEVIDPDLEKTDLGKVLLEADLQLKKDVANFSSPNTPEGRQYWDKLYQKAQSLFGQQEISVPTLTRPWIVPAEVVIRKTRDSAYIYKATLKVMLEQDYLKDSPEYKFDDPRLKELNNYSSQLMRELVIPRLTREVNSSKRYASLRQVYYSLTLAQWFKQSFKGRQGEYARFIDGMDLTGLTSKTPWSKNTYFKAYQQSFAKGEYDRQETRSGPYGMTVRRYFSGGILPLADAKTIQVELAGRGALPDNSLLKFSVPANNLDPSGIVGLPSGKQDPGAGKKDGGLESVQFLMNLEAGKDYLGLKEAYKKLLSLNQVKAIYELEDTINKWEKGKRKALKDKYQALKREAVWENVEADKNNSLYGLLEALKDKEEASLLSKAESRDTLVRVNDWLIRPGYHGYLVNKLKSMIATRSRDAWQALIQCFYMIVDFGTAGKRGQQVEKDRASADVLPGPNIINDYTVAEYTVAQGRYLLANGQAERGVVLSGDTRIKSSLPRVHKGQTEQAYTDLQSDILRKMGVKVYKFSEPRSIGEAAWATVMLDAASMAYNSASHNLWHDNGVKASNEFSSQLFAKEKDAYKAYIEEVLPEDIAALEDAPFKAEEIILNVDKVTIDGVEVVDIDGEYIKAARSFVTDDNIIKEYSKDVKSFYSPVQGSGVYTISRMLNDGPDFEFDVTVSRLQRYQDTEGQFITVDKPDPAYEDETAKKKTIDVAIKEAEEIEKNSPGVKFDFICATDPDSDRSVFVVRDNQGNWKMLKANDVWALLGWYMLNQRMVKDKLPKYAIKTWVTTDLVKEIASNFGLTVIEPAVGFNKIAEVALKEIAIPELLGKAPSKDFMKKVEALEKEGKPLTLDFIATEIKKTRSETIKEINNILRKQLLMGVEESNGFSPGGHTLEKDAAVAVMIFHEVAAYAKYLNEIIKSGKIAVDKNTELTNDLLHFKENNSGKELTIYDLLNLVYIRYGYFATENKPLTFDDSPQGKQDKEIVLSHLNNRLGHAEAVKFGTRQAVRTKTGNQYMNGYEDNGEKVDGHGTNLVFNEPGFRFELNEKGSDYITFRPSGTEPYIRTYGQLKAPNKLDWKNIEDEKAKADKEIAEIVKNAQEYARQNLKFAKDWQAIRSNAKAGFKVMTTIYQAVFDDKQQAAFEKYFKGYGWPEQTAQKIKAGLKTIVYDLPTTDAAKAQNKKVVGNGLGVLSVIRQYGQNLAEGLKLGQGKRDLREILASPEARDFLHSIVITSGGQAQRNAKYSQIGKILAKIPMAEKDLKEARYILDALLDISVNIERNYFDKENKAEFMFAIIYGDALISFDPEELAKRLANKETRENLACMLLKMDYKTSPSYGFAKLNKEGNKVEMFQEKYNLIKRDDKGEPVLKEEATAIRDLGTKQQQDLLEKLEKKEGDFDKIMKEIFPSEKERYDLMELWLGHEKQGYLTEDGKINMNPAFSVLGIEAFLRVAFISGLTDKDGNIEVDSNGKIVYQADSYLSLALDGKLPEQQPKKGEEKAGTKINIDYYGNIVPSFSKEGKKDKGKEDTISAAVNAKETLYAVPFDGVWYDTGEIGGEKDTNLRQGGKAEDTIRVLQVADTYNLRPSVNSQAKIAGKNAENYGMDSWAEANEGAVNPLSILADSFVKTGSLILGKGAQLYNVLFKNIASLEIADNYVLTLSTLERDGQEYIVPVIWDHRDDMKKGYFGGRADAKDPDTAVLIAVWAKEKGLMVEKIIDGYTKKEQEVNEKPEKDRRKEWKDKVDLYSAKLFPIISLDSFKAWNGDPEKKIADSEKELLNDLPEILKFLQHKRADAPQTYIDAVAAGRVASRADTYSKQAPGALSDLRDKIKDAVDTASGKKKATEKASQAKDQNDDKKGGDSGSSSSVPAKDNSGDGATPATGTATGPMDTGGVDFRAIPVGGQMINPLPLTPRVMEMANSASIQDLNEEWRDIEGRTMIGPVPYDKLKEYVAACCQRQDTARQIEEIQSWVNNVLSLEEAAAVPTSQELKEVLLALG